MITVDGPANSRYNLGAIYKLVDSSKKTFNLGQKWRKNRGLGFYYFRYSAAAVPNSAALGEAKLLITTILKKNGKVKARQSKTISIFIK